MTLTNYPDPEVAAFGKEVIDALFKAKLSQAMGGLGGCGMFSLDDFHPDMHPYIAAYLEGNNDSMAILYAAMKTKERELL